MKFPILCLASFLLAGATVHATDKLWTGSIDISENENSYTVRIVAQDAAALDVRKTGTTLVVASGLLPGGARHTQRIELPLASQDAAPQTSISTGELAVTIPKRAPGSSAPAATPNLAGITDLARQFLGSPDPIAPGKDSSDPLRDQVMDQMAALSRQFDRLADNPGAASEDLFGSLLSQFATPAAPATRPAFDLQELPDRYILTAPVPEEQAKNIGVNVDDERFLTITSRREASTKSPGQTGSASSTSTTAMSLPGPVQADRISMDYKDGKISVTLPKK